MNQVSKKNSLKTKNGLEVFKVLGGRSNVFLISNQKENILVDTGVSFMRKKLLRRLSELGIAKVNYMILTHSHFDHTGNARMIRDKFKPLTIIQKEESQYLVSGELLAPKGTSFLPQLLLGWFLNKISDKIKFRPCSYDLLLEEQLDMDYFGFNVYLKYTPGHSPGSLSIIVDDEIALVGDTMFGVFPWSIFPPFALDIPEMIKSWGSLLDTGCRVFLPSHGGLKSRKQVEKAYKKWRVRMEKIKPS
jgi:glyoxylase-like metal-dependent hydrolase (beta-lactamase superfamily II)